MLKQGQYAPLTVGEMVSVIYAADSGLFDDIETDRISQFKEEWFKYFKANHKDLKEQLDRGAKFEGDVKDGLTKALESFKSGFVA